MPKVTDIAAYWKELAAKHGIDKELEPMLEALEKNENVRKALTEGFKPLPDYSHDLDAVRERTKQEKDQEYSDWHQKELKKYDEYVKSVERLQQYETKFGQLDAEVKNQMATPAGLTKAEFEQLLDARLSSRDSAYMDLLEIRESHLGTFKKPLDVKSFEEQWKAHPEWGNSMRTAYKEFIEPEARKIEEADWNAKLKQKYEEGMRDGFSRRSLPTDSDHREFSPLFDRKEEVAKMTESDQERHSREAFFEGLRGEAKPA